MARTNLNIRISPDLKARLATEAAKDNMDISEYLREKLPELVKSETVGISFGDEGTTLVSRDSSRVMHIGERLKSVIADAVETKLYLKTLGINLSDDQGPPAWMRPYLPNIAGNQPQHLYQPPEPKRDIKEWVMELKAIETLDKKETDPEIKAMLKELKDATVKALDKPKESPRSSVKERIDELKEYAMTMRIFGSDKEAQQAETALRQEIAGIRSDLHDAEMAAVKRESQHERENLQRQIDEIKHAPSQFDQITQISQLSHQDPAIKAYLHKKLGIEQKGELTPEKLKGYIESVQIPIGQLLTGIWEQMQKRSGATVAKMPPPPPHEPSEEELAEKVLPPEALQEATPPPAPLDPKDAAIQLFLAGTPIGEVQKQTGLSPSQLGGIKGSLVRAGQLPRKEGTE